MRNSFSTVALLAAGLTLGFGGTTQADTWTGDGDGSSWEDADNWLLDAVPLNNGSGNTFINVGDVVFDADTWAALDAANNLQSSTQYRVVRFLLNEATSAPIGVGSITFDHGDGNQVLQTNSTSAVIGSRTGTTTVNLLSGTVNTGSTTTFGARDGVGNLNVSGGLFTVGRGDLVLGNAAASGTGFVNVSGGALTTRAGAIVNAGSAFEVVGSGASEIGIGSNGSIDGFWTQSGVLSTGIDASGITAILIDDVDDDGAGAQGNVTFEAGSILDPYDLGGAVAGIWTTVMSWEGTLTDNGLALSVDSIAAGWEKRVDGNDLQVRLAVIPEPGSLALALCGGVMLLARRRA